MPEAFRWIVSIVSDVFDDMPIAESKTTWIGKDEVVFETGSICFLHLTAIHAGLGSSGVCAQHIWRVGSGPTGASPDFDQQRRGSDTEERIQRRINALIQTEEHLDSGNGEGSDALTEL